MVYGYQGVGGNVLSRRLKRSCEVSVLYTTCPATGIYPCKKTLLQVWVGSTLHKGHSGCIFVCFFVRDLSIRPEYRGQRFDLGLVEIRSDPLFPEQRTQRCTSRFYRISAHMPRRNCIGIKRTSLRLCPPIESRIMMILASMNIDGEDISACKVPTLPCLRFAFHNHNLSSQLINRQCVTISNVIAPLE